MDKTSDGAAAMDGFVKVRFELPKDPDGWPPATSEGLWAVPVAPDIVRLDNTPWFVRNIACGDRVRVREGADGVVWAEERVQWSGNCTIRIIPYREGPLGGSWQRVVDAFTPLGVTGEVIEQYRMIALDVPPDVDLAVVKRLLRDGERDGWWGYEVGCGGDAWRDAGAD